MPKENAIQLIRWEEPVTFIWIPFKVQRKINPFREAMISGRNLLIDLGIKLAPGYFLRVLDSIGQEMTGEVGFLLQDERVLPLLEEQMYMETWQPTLFASMECSSSNEFLCFQFIQMIRQYGFRPSGAKIEKYETPESEIFQYLIPLMNHKEL
ncbi:hypothetical protein [Neobacillus sp. D3-1R]|uniref:hypothetical protein n=1 Tax=Neobacillus sp. D3-1R TaxID=3445778 RepID=UPI003F9F2152